MASTIPALDGLRGIAILLVLLHHFTILEPATSGDAWLAYVARIGWVGVDLFFVLSGFLITGILIDARDSDRYFTSFYARRTLRIFPLYYLVTFLSLVVLPHFPFWFDLLAGPGAPREQLPYWLYLTNFAVAARERFMHGVLDISWSLAIEEQFYLVWPAVVWFCPPRALGWLCAGLIGLATLGRLAALGSGTAPIAVYVLPFFRADALATGALLAWLARRGSLDGLHASGPWAFWVGAGGVVAVCWLDGDSWWWGEAMQRAGYSLVALAAAGALIAALNRRTGARWPRLLAAGWLRAFGKYSYALYLFHLPVLRVVREFVFGPDSFDTFGAAWLGQIVFYVAATLPAMALAWLSWHLVERRVLRAKAWFPYEHTRPIRGS